jgi:hypothetical protein
MISGLKLNYYYGIAYLHCKRNTFVMKTNSFGFELLNNNVLECVYSYLTWVVQ